MKENQLFYAWPVDSIIKVLVKRNAHHMKHRLSRNLLRKLLMYCPNKDFLSVPLLRIYA